MENPLCTDAWGGFLGYIGFQSVRSGVQSRKYVTAIICSPREWKDNYMRVFAMFVKTKKTFVKHVRLPSPTLCLTDTIRKKVRISDTIDRMFMHISMKGNLNRNFFSRIIHGNKYYSALVFSTFSSIMRASQILELSNFQKKKKKEKIHKWTAIKSRNVKRKEKLVEGYVTKIKVYFVICSLGFWSFSLELTRFF